MNAALGRFGVALGLAASVFAVVVLAVGLRKRRPDLLRLGGLLVWFAFAGSLFAFVAMERALITNDTTLRYVAENGSSKTPFPFNVATLWAALEGSIILWSFVLGGYLVLVGRKFRTRMTDPLVGWALLTMFVVSAFFFALMLGPANPFTTWSPPPGFDGPGPNPLLQYHVLMAFHPPMLYLGYVGFTVPFAFAIAALVTGRLGEGWLLETRRWTLFAWGFLTVGIILGAWWSYEVLGWGGYWAWDPVENASLLPWLTGTAYLHSVMVQERRGMLRVWNLSLLCATFALTILGTFLTRSGVIQSVHAFTESGIGPWLLSFFTVIVVVSVGLIAWRGDRLRSPGRIDSPLSREGAFLANNVVFGAFAFVVLLGTVFPLVAEAVNESNRLSVGTPYFNRMTMPLGLTILFLMAVAPVVPWRKASAELLRERLFWPAWLGTAAVVAAVALGVRGLAPLVAFFLAGLGGGSALRQLVIATRRNGWRGLVGRTNGGMVVHLGVVMIACAIAVSSSFVHQAELKLEKGQSATVGGHTVTFVGTAERIEPNRFVSQALVLVDGKGPYAPALNRFGSGSALVGTPSVRTSLTNDVMLTLLALPEGPDQPVAIRVIVQPLIIWLWIGGGVMALGTVLAAFPGRRRNPLDPVSAAPYSGTADAEPPSAPTADEAAPPEPAGVS